jgi:uncharacterized RDD family membrane protein YckC
MFNRVTLQTPESVELEFKLAGIGSRALALLVDYLIQGAVLTVLLIGWAFTIAGLPERPAQFVTALGSLGLFALYVGYFVCFETLWQGQTPGKRFARIRVVREDGRPVGLAQTTLRALLRPIDDLLYIGVLIVIFGRREKRLGDLAAGTLVIQEERTVDALQISERAAALAARIAREATVSALSPDDFAVVREFLSRRNTLDARARARLAAELTSQVQARIGLGQLPNNADVEAVLEAVYLAYQQST